jgi:AcrR family transcriptional regulator
MTRRRRKPPQEQRRQILDVATRLLNQHGVDSVQITAVAQAAGVSRPLVYRLFPTRRALIVALLEDFVAALDARFQRALPRVFPGSLSEIVTAFVEACCEAIEERGAGAWRLLDARGVDAELTRAGHRILLGLVEPWHPRITELTGLSARRTNALALVVVAAGRAMLEGWLDRAVGRKEAIRDTTRVVTALLAEFARAAQAR